MGMSDELNIIHTSALTLLAQSTATPTTTRGLSALSPATQVRAARHRRRRCDARRFRLNRPLHHPKDGNAGQEPRLSLYPTCAGLMSDAKASERRRHRELMAGRRWARLSIEKQGFQAAIRYLTQLAAHTVRPRARRKQCAGGRAPSPTICLLACRHTRISAEESPSKGARRGGVAASGRSAAWLSNSPSCGARARSIAGAGNATTTRELASRLLDTGRQFIARSQEPARRRRRVLEKSAARCSTRCSGT